MAKVLILCGFCIFLLSATYTYAANGKPCLLEKLAEKKIACKTSEKIIPEKLLKIRALNELKVLEKPIIQPSASAADTFESLIAPFLKAVTPHFYDQIINRGKKPSQVQS
ncbi:MAG: hypothetical protein H7Y07_02435 [Pyrinomonadaceae bacterium]|nr:hypothetical protein [Sphingobacteriaceae bacterium]